ncbi:LOW QUALITY PROTEIN: Sperm protein associated with the nucleus on the X chromosome N2 [Plecturocebus cupreus]
MAATTSTISDVHPASTCLQMVPLQTNICQIVPFWMYHLFDLDTTCSEQSLTHSRFLGGQELWDNLLRSFHIAVDVCILEKPSIHILEPAIIMEDPTSSTNEENKKSSSESNTKENNEQKQETVKVLAPQQSLKKTKKSKYPTILELSCKKDEKINSNQLGNDQSKEKSTDPKKDEDLDSSEGSSQVDEDLDLWEVSSLEDEDLELWEVSSLEDEDLDDSSDGSIRSPVSRIVSSADTGHPDISAAFSREEAWSVWILPSSGDPEEYSALSIEEALERVAPLCS